METNLLDRMLETYLDGQTPVTMTLQNKIRVSGKIKAFDSYVIVLEGQKREIVYRHAVSCVSPVTLKSIPEQKRSPRTSQPVALPKRAPSRPTKAAPHKPRPAQPQALPAVGEEQGINNSMKDGLLRWMQEQKAAK
jgi:RNA chaperone Hfq